MKLFFFDIDGTLISCNDGIYEIPDSTKASMDQLKVNNRVFLATGRCPCFLLDGVTTYNFDGLVSCNGALVIYNDNIMYKSVISIEALNAVMDFAKKYHSVVYLESKDNIFAVNTDHPIHEAFLNEWGMKKETLIYDFDINEIETYIGMIVLNDESEVEIMNDTLSKYFNIQKHQHGLSFDLTIKGESKAKGIEQLIKVLDMSMDDTVAFGDGRNDVEMIESVGYGIAMGNAAKETKKKSKYITSNVKDDGITYALKKLNYIK